MEWSRRVECHIFLIYQKLTVQDFNFQLFGILRVSTLRFGGSPLPLITFYLNLSSRGVNHYIFYDLSKLINVYLQMASIRLAELLIPEGNGAINSLLLYFAMINLSLSS